MKKLWTGLSKLARDIKNKVTNTVKYHPAVPLNPNRQRPEIARRSKHTDFASKSMRRGVQTARARAQRPRRLAAIANSVRQGIEVRAAFRKHQLARRHVRAELRAAVTPA